MFTINNSKIFFLLMTIFLVLSLSACQPSQKITEPNTTLRTVDGKFIEPSDYKGKWIFVNYWADWCGPCHMEIKDLNAFYAEKKYDDMILMGVNADGATDDELKAKVTKMGIQFPVVEEDVGRLFGIDAPRGLPTTFVISPDRHVVALVGPRSLAEFKNAMH